LLLTSLYLKDAFFFFRLFPFSVSLRRFTVLPRTPRAPVRRFPRGLIAAVLHFFLIMPLSGSLFSTTYWVLPHSTVECCVVPRISVEAGKIFAFTHQIFYRRSSAPNPLAVPLPKLFPLCPPRFRCRICQTFMAFFPIFFFCPPSQTLRPIALDFFAA